MRRYIVLMGVLAVLVAALGCRHVGGKCDCGYNPADYPIQPPVNPHPSAPPAPVKVVPPKGGNE